MGEVYTTFDEHLSCPVLPLVGYRYTAYSGFLFRVTGPVSGIALGWIF